MRMMSFAFLLTCASGMAAQAQEPKSFKDWIVGCDNLRTCTAIGLAPENDSQYAFVKVVRAGDAHAEPSVTFTLWDDNPEGPVGIALSLDTGKGGVPSRLEGARDGQFARATLTGGQARAALDAMRQAKTLTLRLADKPGQDGTGTVSLSGSAASLLFMDAQQNRAKTVTALVAKGDAPATGIPPVPPMPVVPARPIEEIAKLPSKPPAGVVRLGDDDCGSIDQSLMAYKLSLDRTLWGVCSSAGAYNFRYRFTMIAQGKAALAKFPLPGQAIDSEENATLVSPYLSEDKKVISSFDKGRGIGDCGVSADWAWDGNGFRLIEYRVMGECRGVPLDDWPVLYRAQRG